MPPEARPSVLGYVADARKRGLEPAQAAAEYKAKYGVEMWVAARKELPPAMARGANPEPQGLPVKKAGSPGEWLPGTVVGGAGMAAGALGGLASWALPRDKSSAAAQLAFEASEKQRVQARGKPTATTFLEDLGNAAAGLHVLGSRVANVEPVQGIDDPVVEHTTEDGTPVVTRSAPTIIDRLKRTFVERARQGEELGGGLVGGSASLLKGLATEPLQTVHATPFTVGSSLLPAARGLRAGGRAVGEAGAAMPGLRGALQRGVGAVAKAAEPAEAMRAAGNYLRTRPEQAAGVAEQSVALGEDLKAARIARDAAVTDVQAATAVGDEGAGAAAAAKLKEIEAAVRHIERGQAALRPTGTAYKAGEMLTKAATPVQQALQVAERAALGAGALGDFVGLPAAAVLGAAGPPALRALLTRIVPPERRAGFERWTSDYTAQATPEASEQVRAATTGIQDLESRVQAAVDEYSGTVREEGLHVDPTGLKARTPKGRTVEHEVGDTGELTASPQAVQTLASGEPAVAEAAARMGAAQALSRKRVPGADVLAGVEQEVQRASGVPQTEEAARTAAGLEGDVKSSKIPVAPLHPRQRQIAEDLWREVNKLAPEGRGFELPEVMRWLTDVARGDSISRLRDPGLRGRVANEISRGSDLPEAMANKLKLDVENQIVHMTETALGEDYANMAITMPDGRKLSVAAVADDIFKKLPEAERRDTMQSALTQMGQHLSEQIGKRRKRFVTHAELRRFERPFGAGTSAEWLVEMLRRVGAGEPPPLVDLDRVMAGGEGLGATSGKEVRAMPSRSLGGLLRSNPDAWAQQAGVPRQLVERMAEHLEAFEPLTTQAMESRHGLELPGGTQAHHGYNSSMTTYLELTDMARQASDMARLGRMATRNLTARNVPTHVTNVSENLFRQSLDAGTDPVSVAVGWRNTFQKYLDFRAGKKIDPSDADGLRALGATGTVYSGAIDDIIRRGVGSPARGRVVAGAQKAGALLDETYSMGDVVPKLDEGLRNWRWLREGVDEMEPGSSVTLRTKDGRAVKIERTPEGRYRIDGRAPLDASHPEVGNALAEVAMVPPMQSLVDYRRMPKAIAEVKKAGPLAAASPFLTWGWKVLDLPGKPGVLSALFGRGGFVLDSTSPAWWNRTALQYAGIATRRAALIQAVYGQITDRDHALNKLLAREPDETHTAFVAATTNPLDVAAYSDWSRGAWTGPFDRLMRLGTAVVTAATLKGREAELFPEEPAAGTPQHADWSRAVEGMQPARRALWDFHARQGARWGDAVELFGLDRPLVSSLLRDLNRSESVGDQKAMAAAAVDLGKMFVGGTPMGALDAAIGVVAGPDVPGTQRRTSTVAPYGAEPAVKHVWRSLIGVGYRDAVLSGKLEEYLTRTEQALTKSVMASAEREQEALLAQATQADAELRNADAAVLRSKAALSVKQATESLSWLVQAQLEILARHDDAMAAMRRSGESRRRQPTVMRIFGGGHGAEAR